MVVTLDLPEPTYKQIRTAAKRARRPFNDVLVEAVTAVAPVFGTVPKQVRSDLAQMAYLNDAALWQAARATMSVKQRERLQALHHEQQRRPLTRQEQAEEQGLLALYRETMLVRAQAAVLLKQRGYDISDLSQFQPLS
ncbi:MAG: hypothetical protein ACPGWR_20505 [Ardenticatenaceae bacterium]